MFDDEPLGVINLFEIAKVYKHPNNNWGGGIYSMYRVNNIFVDNYEIENEEREESME